MLDCSKAILDQFHTILTIETDASELQWVHDKFKADKQSTSHMMAEARQLIQDEIEVLIMNHQDKRQLHQGTSAFNKAGGRMFLAQCGNDGVTDKVLKWAQEAQKIKKLVARLHDIASRK